MNGFDNTTIRVRKFLLLEAVDVNFTSMFVRSYMFNNITDKTITSFENAIKSNMGGSATISTAGCAESFGGLFGLSNRPTVGVVMPNGNRQGRFKFILDLERAKSSGTVLRYIIQGYTDSNEISSSGALPYEMNFHINSITEYYTSVKSDGTLDIRLLDTYNTISGMETANNAQAMELVTSRVKDLHQIMSLKEEDLMGYGGGMSIDVSNIGNVTSSDVITSTRSNIDPISYLVRLLNTYQEGSSINATSYDESTSGRKNILDNAARRAAEPIFGRNEVIQLLSMVANTNYSSNVINYGLLLRAFGDLSNVTTIVCGNSAAKLESSIASRRNEMGLQQYNIDPMAAARTDMITTKVLEFNHSVVSYMSQVGITEASIRVGFAPSGVLFNGGSILASVLSARSLLGEAYVIPGCNRLETLMKTIALPKFMSNMETVFSMVLDINILGDSVIDVYVPDFNYKETFRFPSFCDALYMPVLTTRQERNVFCNDLAIINDMVDSTSRFNSAW